MTHDLSAVRRLHYDRILAPGAEPHAWMLVLHGIYGSGRNWASIARRFVRARPEWGCVLVDLRGHGSSTGFQPPHTIEACANDVLELVRGEGIDARAILGHSFGGKVALEYAWHAAIVPDAPHLEQIWVVDSTPAAGTPAGTAWRMLRVLRQHPGPFESREAGIAAVEAEGYARPVAQWMSTNLVSDGAGGLHWRLDADFMEELLRSFYAVDAWDPIDHPPPGCEIHVIKARESSVIDENVQAHIEAAGLATGHVHLHEVDGGHWVNADNPDALQRLLGAHVPLE